MTALLVLAAVLLLASGAVKLRASERVGLGLPLLPLLEVGVGLALAASPVLYPLSARGGLAAVLAALLLLVLSSVQVGTAVRARSRHRRLTEGARLRTYVQYLSESPDAGRPGAGADGGEPR